MSEFLNKITLPRLAVTLWLAAVALLAAAILHQCGGNLIYTLDDPYIHLALAHNLTHGWYGINPTEHASPSSSILWPYLLALTSLLKLGTLAPLLLNLPAAALTLIVMSRTMNLAENQPKRARLPLILGSAIVIILTSSAVALPFTGMEHTWHVLAVALTFAGLASLAEGKKPSTLFWAGLVLMPLIRFEGLAYTGIALATLWLYGERRNALLAAAAVGASLLAYGVFMHTLNLPLLPSSVLVKSDVVRTGYDHGSLWSPLIKAALTNLECHEGIYLALLTALLAGLAWPQRKNRRITLLYLGVIATVAAHFALGRMGWFYRYEIYINTLAVMAVFHAFKRTAPHLPQRGRLAAAALLLVALMLAFKPYVHAMRISPAASANIYQQQYQMARFAQQLYPHPVAVNDLGLVSYRNPNYVLDLWGLGSEEVRKLKASNTYTAAAMEDLASRHNVHMVIIYRKWFPQGVPASWKEAATLHTPKVTAAWGDVTFYLTPQANAEEARQALEQLRTSLPPEDTLTFPAP